MTAPVGRDAFLTCVVQDLGPYKVRLGGKTNLLITAHRIGGDVELTPLAQLHTQWAATKTQPVALIFISILARARRRIRNLKERISTPETKQQQQQQQQ